MVMDLGVSAGVKALFYLHKRRGCDSYSKPLPPPSLTLNRRHLLYLLINLERRRTNETSAGREQLGTDLGRVC